MTGEERLWGDLVCMRTHIFVETCMHALAHVCLDLSFTVDVCME